MAFFKMEVAPSHLYLSLRGIQYAFHEAISDLVDNSIDANAVNIWIEANKDEIIVADDGDGMTRDELEVAITPWKAGGSKSLKQRRGKRGKFGIGLKSASYSVGECLTIHTKSDSDSFHLLELDHQRISKMDDAKAVFESTHEITPLFKRYCSDNRGTVLQINKVKGSKVTTRGIDSLKNLLGLIYFKLIEEGTLRILVNNEAISPLNPIMPGLKKNSPSNFYKDLGTQVIDVAMDDGTVATFKLKGAYVGRGAHWTDEDRKRYRYFLKRSTTKEDSLRRGQLKLDEQGIYTLRNGRLITLGGWHGLASENTLLHHNTPTRVLLEFDENGDELMGLDSTKTQLKAVERLSGEISNFIRDYVNDGAKLFREEGAKIVLDSRRSETSNDVKNLSLKKESAKAAYKMEERRRKSMPEYEDKQTKLEHETDLEAANTEELAEIKDKLPWGNLWDYKFNKDNEILLLLNSSHPGYHALQVENDPIKLTRNNAYFLYTLAMFEASLKDLFVELKPNAFENVEKCFKMFRRWVSKHFTEFDQ